MVIIRNLNSPLSGVWDDLNGLAPMAFGVVSLLIFVVRSVFIARKFNSDIKNFFGKSLKDYEFQLLMEEHKEIFIPDNLFN